MKLIKTEEIDGMIRNTYDNGTVEEYLSSCIVNQVSENLSISLSDQQQAIYETAINTEYLVALADLGL